MTTTAAADAAGLIPVRLTPATMQALLAALAEAAEFRRMEAAGHHCGGLGLCGECRSLLDGADDYDHAAAVLAEAGGSRA